MPFKSILLLIFSILILFLIIGVVTKNKVLKIISLGLFYISQLGIICLSFIGFTGTMEIFPWHDTDPLGAFILLIMLIPFQCIISLYWFMYKEIYIPKLNKIISILNLGAIISFIMLAAENAAYFNKFSVPFAIFECILMAFLLFTAIKWLIKKQYK